MLPNGVRFNARGNREILIPLRLFFRLYPFFMVARKRSDADNLNSHEREMSLDIIGSC